MMEETSKGTHHSLSADAPTDSSNMGTVNSANFDPAAQECEVVVLDRHSSTNRSDSGDKRNRTPSGREELNPRKRERDRDYYRDRERKQHERDRERNPKREHAHERERGEREYRERDRENRERERRYHHSSRREDSPPSYERRSSRSEMRSRSRERSKDVDSKSSGGKYLSVKRQGSSGDAADEGRKDVQQDGVQTQEAKVPFVVSSGKTQRSDVRVREIWLGNLPESISKKVLYSHFFICGEIEEIELYRVNKQQAFYAFIRFKLTSCTKRAFDLAQNLEIDGVRVKVQFSDFNKRPVNIIGDTPDYDLTPENCTTLFVAFSVNSKLPDQPTIEKIFSSYGRVRAIWMKQTAANTTYRPHAFVDYYLPDEAKLARREMFENDQYGLKRAELGDKSCEILFAIRKRNKDFSNPHAYQQLGKLTSISQSHTTFQQHTAPSQHPFFMQQSMALQTGNPYQQQAFAQQPAPSQLPVQQTTPQPPNPAPVQVPQQAPQPEATSPSPPSTNAAQHPLLISLMQFPPFRAIMQSKPEITKSLIQEIQKNPDCSREHIMQTISNIITSTKSTAPQQKQQSPTSSNNNDAPPVTSEEKATPAQNTQQAPVEQPTQQQPATTQATLAQSQFPGVLTGQLNPQLRTPLQQQQALLQSRLAAVNTQQQLLQQRLLQQHPRPIAPQYIQPRPQHPANPAAFNPLWTGTSQFPQQPEQHSVQQQEAPQTPAVEPSGSKPKEAESSCNILDFIKQKKQVAEEVEGKNQSVQQGYRAAEEATQKQQQPLDILDDDEKNIWSGFVTRNKQHRVCMEAYTVSGNHEQFLADYDHNLNVSHRTNYEDVGRYKVQGVVAFVPQNNTQEEQFKEYIDYFEKKERAGLAFLRNGMMFLLPPCEISAMYFKHDRPHMVGIFGDAQAAAAQSARFSGQPQNNSNMVK